jgi:hypothetical protein
MVFDYQLTKPILTTKHLANEMNLKKSYFSLKNSLITANVQNTITTS